MILTGHVGRAAGPPKIRGPNNHVNITILHYTPWFLECHLSLVLLPECRNPYLYVVLGAPTDVSSGVKIAM